MDILKVAQRIRSYVDSKPIRATDAIALGEKLDKMGATNHTRAQHGIGPSLKLIGEAIAFGEGRQMFTLMPATQADFSVILRSTKDRMPQRTADELLATPGMFVGTRGIEHILHHCRVQ